MNKKNLIELLQWFAKSATGHKKYVEGYRKAIEDVIVIMEKTNDTVNTNCDPGEKK